MNWPIGAGSLIDRLAHVRNTTVDIDTVNWTAVVAAEPKRLGLWIGTGAGDGLIIYCGNLAANATNAGIQLVPVGGTVPFLCRSLFGPVVTGVICAKTISGAQTADIVEVIDGA